LKIYCGGRSRFVFGGAFEGDFRDVAGEVRGFSLQIPKKTIPLGTDVWFWVESIGIQMELEFRDGLRIRSGEDDFKTLEENQQIKNWMSDHGKEDVGKNQRVKEMMWGDGQ